MDAIYACGNNQTCDPQTGQCTQNTPQCTPGNYCKDNTTTGYQNSDCTWSNIQTCGSNQACNNGTCTSTGNPQRQCQTGWFCQDSSHYAYLNQDCTWSSTTVCNPSQTCSNGACTQTQPGNQGQQPTTCNPGWYCTDTTHSAYLDPNCSMNNQQQCQNGCDNTTGQCKGTQAPTCTPNDHKACNQGNLYWYDTCNNPGSLAQDCSGNGCTGNTCNPTNGNGSGGTCTPNDHKACYLGDSWWFNSCNQLGNEAQNCNGNGCTNGECSTPKQIGPLNMGWVCKDNSTMAYKLDDGTLTNELQCASGCADNLCNTPSNWPITSPKISSQNNKTRTPKGPEILFLLPLAVEIFGSLEPYFDGFVTAFVAFGTTILLTHQNGQFLIEPWPTYGHDWVGDETYFEDHYARHIDLIEHAYGRKFLPQDYKDICKDQINDNSMNTSRFKQNDGRFVSLNITTGLVVIGTPDAKIVTCFIPDSDSYINDKIKDKEWTPIPQFNKIIIG